MTGVCQLALIVSGQHAGTVPPASPAVRPRNDPAQYDDLVDAWGADRGPFAMLHWLAAARAEIVPRPRRPGALLVDVGCGGGLLAPHLAGYRHVGVDITHSALVVARGLGVEPVRADAARLPLRTGCADVVVAGEILEHVPDLPSVLAELCRVLAPGGTLVIDAIAATWLARLVAVDIAERLPGGPPARLHDPALFVDRRHLVELCAGHGVPLRIRGLRPSAIGYVGWLAGRPATRMVPSRLSAVLFQAVGVKDRAERTDVAARDDQ
jgi:2-polyprenyl-6-hydroxyphenyl methylase/3-demethylubiquinone-9 3-methyltransferase